MGKTIFTGLRRRLARIIHRLGLRLRAYLRRLLFPLYLFPLKLVTYSTFYLLRALVHFILEMLRILRDMAIFPFRSLRNLLKSLFLVLLLVYITASLFVIVDYIYNEYGDPFKFLCRPSDLDSLQDHPVRIIGYGRGTGFFISPQEILTNYHVIEGAAAPKVILPDDRIPEVTHISANQVEDLALIEISEPHPELVFEFGDSSTLTDGEYLISFGFAWDAELETAPIYQEGSARGEVGNYLLTNIILNHGMSGGPLLDRCGQVMGVNTAGVGGLSMFISSNAVRDLRPTFNSDGLLKLELDPSASPADAVTAFYTYLGARNMQESYQLLSRPYLAYTNYEEWTSRFANILDIKIVRAEPVEGEDDIVFVKFITTSLEDSLLSYHYYEGTWEVVLEDDVYKMYRSKILEVSEPDWSWHYSGPEF